jgi:hypothetical protein
VTTAREVLELACDRYGRAGVAELGAVYAGLRDADRGVARRVALTPPAAGVGFAVGVLLADALRRVGPGPDDLLRINVYDPRCGVGALLVEGARRLAGLYARRLAAEGRAAAQTAAFVLPRIVRECVYGMDTDPLAVEVARLALWLETCGEVTPQDLQRHIVVGDHRSGEVPPGKAARAGTVDLVPIAEGRS